MSSQSVTPTERSPLLRASNSSSTLTDSSNDEHGANPSNNVVTTSKTRGTLIVGSIYVLIFILTSNVSLLTTIQSPIAIELKAFSSVSWFTSAYLIAITSITPLAGRLSQIFTPKKYLFASVVFQSLGILVTSQARTLWLFLLGRVMTGMGSAAVAPVAFILVTELTSKERRGLFFGLINTGYTTGVALGAIVAGALEPVVGWRAVFWLQIPILTAAATVALFAIPSTQPSDSKHTSELSIAQKLSGIDYFGTFTIISAVVLLLYSLAAPKVDPRPILLSFAMLILFIFVESKWAHEPIVPLAVLQSKANIATGIATIGIMTARWGVLFYSPIYAITIRDWSPASAGLMLLPTNGGFALGGILAGWLHIRRAGSFYVATLIAFFLFAIFLVVISQISTPDTNIWVYVSCLFANGFVTGALLNYTLAHVLHLTLPVTHVIVIPLQTMFRSLSASFGSSISGGLFIRKLRAVLISEFEKRGMASEDELVSKLLGSPVLVRSLSGVEKEVALLGYQEAIKALFMAGSAIAIVAGVVQALTGWIAPIPVEDGADVLSNQERISPVVSRETVAD